MEQYKTYKIEFKKSWNNSSNKIDTVTKFQEYEYKTKEYYYHITLCIFVLNYKVYITITIEGTKFCQFSYIRYMYNYNNVEFDYLRLVNKQIYRVKEQDIEKNIQNILQFLNQDKLNAIINEQIGI